LRGKGLNYTTRKLIDLDRGGGRRRKKNLEFSPGKEREEVLHRLWPFGEGVPHSL